MAGMLTVFSLSAKAQRAYVDVRPQVSVHMRTEAPSHAHILVSDEWVFRGGRYENVPEHWEVPPRGHKHWVSGQWRHQEGHGHYWTAGHWRELLRNNIKVLLTAEPFFME